MTVRRNPQDVSKTVNKHFYLPPYGAFGPEEYDRYNLAREDLDRHLRAIEDKSYTQPGVFGYALDVPDISSFYDLEYLPHWRALRGYWKFEDAAGSPIAVDESVFGHDGGTR